MVGHLVSLGGMRRHQNGVGRLFGREKHVQLIMQAFEKVNRGETGVVLLPGVSGSGKTTLATVLQEPANSQNGYFLEGKFNQYDQSLPYVAWRQALAQFCKIVEREDLLQRKTWAERIREAVGSNGQILVDLVPEFEDLIGPQTPVQQISSAEARHRFANVIRHLLRAICRSETPLVLFIDDWQWADSASLHLLSDLHSGEELKFLLLIAAYRCDEVDESHPLMESLSLLRKQRIWIEDIQVENLGFAATEGMVAHLGWPDAESVPELSRRLHESTNGNPFFIRVALEHYHSRLSQKDRETPSLSLVNPAKDLRNGVVSIFLDKIDALEPCCQELLSLAACIGHRFDVETLALICDLSVDSIRGQLDQFTSDLVTPLHCVTDESGKRADSIEKLRWYRFAHDRVQQAAHSRLTSDELLRIRLEVGRKLREHLSAEDLAERICEVVEHVNFSTALISSTEEKVGVIRLNVMAARKAIAATAYRSALAYHRVAQHLLEDPQVAESLWANYHHVGMELLTGQADTEFLEGDAEHAAACVRLAVSKARSPVEEAETLAILIVQHTIKARYAEAISTGREALQALGVCLPLDDYESACASEIAKTRCLLERTSFRQIGDMKEADDAIMRAAAKVMITMGPPCYRSDQALWSLIVPMVVNITLKHGHTPQVGYSYTAFAGLLGWVDNDYATGKELVDLATQLMSKPMASPSDQAVFHLMVGSSARHWYQHLACSSQDYAEAYRVGVQSGNLQYAAYAFGHNMYCCFFQGMELEQLIHESKISLEFSHTRKNQWAIDLLEGGISLFSRMSSQGFTEHCVDENEFLQRVRRHRNEQVECIYWVIKCQMCLILGEKELAIESAERAEELIHMVGTQGLLPWPEHLFSCFLLLVTSDVNISRGSREKKDDTLRRLVTQLSHWEASCPDNFECKSLLARAEMAFRDSKYDQAAELYDRSIESARKYGFIHWEGYANERASLLWRSLGRHRVEQFYWQQAFECFYRWGAVAKATAMGVEFRDYLKDLTVGSPATDSLLASHSPQLSPAMIESRVEQFVKQSSDATMLRHQAARASSVDELADAASNLRIDVAARRKVSDELRRERDQQLKLNDELERRVRERTAALSKAEFRFRNLLESAPIAMVMVDIEGNISLVNSETEQLFGCSRDQLIDSPVHHVFDAATATTADGFHDAAFGALRELSEKDGQTCMFRRRDDTLFPVELGLRSVMIDDSRFLLCAIKDITEQQQTIATAQRAREAAESANRAKSTFLATMSHEIRTPMNGVLGTCELALSTDLTEEQRGYLKTMQRSATSLLDVISDILDLSKIEAGKLELQSQPFSPNQVLVDAFQLLKTNAELNGILMECHIESSIDTPVLGDSGRLRQVLINLIGNAIKFTHAGKVALSSRITGTIGNHVRVNFSVEDTGVGIPPDKLETIFEPFSQIDDSDHRRYGGTGLGLSISSKLVQLMGGTLEVRSQLGAGTNFTFELGFEAASRAVPSQTEPTAVASAVSSIRILLAEDDTTNVLVAKTLLTRWGHEVSVAKNGREAIAMFQTYPYDLILMDVQMPGLDGLEATRGIRVLEEGSGNRIPIVALTAGAMEGDREACLEAGMTDYLAKPVHWAKLNEIIKSLEPVEAKDMPQSKPEMGQLSWDLGSALEEMAVEVAVLREAFEAVLDNLDTQVITLSDARLACDRRAMSDTMDRLHESAQILKLSWLENLVADLQRALSTEDWGAVDFNIELLKNGMPRLKTILTEFANQQCC